MKILKYFRCILFIISFCGFAVRAKDIIFDFGNVLIFTNRIKSFRNIGIKNFLKCAFQLRINPLYLDQHIKKVLFFVLSETGKIHDLKKSFDDYPVYDEQGIELPFLMNIWLRGAMSCAQIRALIAKEIENHPEWFACSAEKQIIRNAIAMIFTPSLFVDSRKISSEGLAFIKRCKREGHAIYGLSNWDPESFLLLKKKYPEFFNLFDGIVISGNVQSNKPDKNIYQILLTTYNLNPANCWFIDDQKENVLAAEKLGINAVIYQESFKKVVKNIRLLYSERLKRFTALTTTGIKSITTKTAANAIIEGEYTSLREFTEYNRVPANV